MTPSDLIDDLKSRINPAYAHQLGTESYERRMCVEALEALQNENAELRAALYDEQYGITATLRNDEMEQLKAIEQAAQTLCKVKGRHHTEIAMKRLMDLCQTS